MTKSVPKGFLGGKTDKMAVNKEKQIVYTAKQAEKRQNRQKKQKKEEIFGYVKKML